VSDNDKSAIVLALAPLYFENAPALSQGVMGSDNPAQASRKYPESDPLLKDNFLDPFLVSR
jgi:hypothetical protein